MNSIDPSPIRAREPPGHAAVNADFASYDEALHHSLYAENITDAGLHFALLAPSFHEEGDMVDTFLDEPASGTERVRVGGHGMTPMLLT